MKHQHTAIELEWMIDCEKTTVSANRAWGVSARQMVEYVLGEVSELKDGRYPWDYSDLKACFRCAAMAPPHLTPKLAEVLAKYISKVLKDNPK